MFGLQSVWAFSMLGPVGNGGDVWQAQEIGYNPLGNTDVAYDIIDPTYIGPKNLGEGYRRNTAVMYYAFSPSFGDYFGSNGEYAVQQAFDILNGAFNGRTNAPLFLYSPNNGILGDTNGSPAILLNVTNSVDFYSAGLTEFPLDSEEVNYQAQVLELQDIKSFTLAVLAEEMGLADPIRYAWALHSRDHVGSIPCPVGMEYTVVQRNFDISPSPVNHVQYSPYVNGELISYLIYENCDAPGETPPAAAARPFLADPLVNNPPVASGGMGLAWLGIGGFYTGLTRDDIAGLRWLYSTNNFDTPSAGYRESPAAGSVLKYTNFNNGSVLLNTSNLADLVSASLTNDPATMRILFPGLVIDGYSNYSTLATITNVTAYYTTAIGSPYGSPPIVAFATNYTFESVMNYVYTFDNVVVVNSSSNTVGTLLTTRIVNTIGTPYPGTGTTNNTTSTVIMTNVTSGDYFLIPPGSCGYDIVSAYINPITGSTNFVTAITNLLTTASTNVATHTNTLGYSYSQSLVTYFTNHWFVAYPCLLGAGGGTNGMVRNYQGIGRIQFIRVRDDNYDYQSGQFITPITNQYTMVVITNGQFVARTFQRVVTTPDFLFEANDQGTMNGLARAENSFNQANIQPGLAGPGTSDPSEVFGFNKVGTLYENSGPSSLIEADASQSFLWGSFDGTTNAPIVYPNGTDLVNLMNEALVQISPPPPTLPYGINGVPYPGGGVTNVAFSATGTGGDITWTLAPVSAGLPPGLDLSADGVLSGMPTQSGTFDNIVIRMTDHSTPPRVVDTGYSLTIY